MQLISPSCTHQHAQLRCAPGTPCPHTNLMQTHSPIRQRARCVVARAAVTGTEPGRLLIFGLGYSSLGVANLCAAQGWHVSCTMRSPKSAVQLASLKPGWQPLIFDPCSQPGVLGDQLQELLRDCTHVLTIIPPVGLPLYDPVLSAQVKAFKKVQPKGLRWLGYVSSTSVYGDHKGQWVDESSDCRSTSPRGYVRHQQELAWAAAAHDKQLAVSLPLHIFRAGGIYGPGRSLISSGRRSSVGEGTAPQREDTQADDGSSKVRRAAQQYISRIHVYDLCQAIMASMRQPENSAHVLTSSEDTNASEQLLRKAVVYNLVDDEPAPRSEVASYVQGLQQQHKGAMPQQSMSSSGQGRSPQSPDTNRIDSSGLEEKRVKNDKAKQELGWVLKYPTYREGMSALLASDLRPFTAADLQWLGMDPSV